MLLQNKGIYPNWVNRADIINQVLREIIREGGKLPFSYVINPDHEEEIQQRMKSILDQMIKEKLIQHPLAEQDFLEIDLEGSRAVHVGYRKYKRIKRWDMLVNKLNRISLLFFALVILVLAGLLIYYILHLLKIV